MGARGLHLYYQCWLPPGPIKAAIALIHGLGTHSGAFASLTTPLVAAGYGVYGLDLRGHGRSQGQRGYVQRWQDFLTDIDRFRALIDRAHPQAPCFMVGHSLGAILMLDYGLRYPSRMAGAIALAPAIGPIGVSPFKLCLGQILSWIWPRFTLDTGIPEDSGAQDPQVLEIYAQDPLRHTKGTARLVTEFLQATHRLRGQLPQLQVPLLLLQGGEDGVALPEGSRRLFRQIHNWDKEYREYAGNYHDLQMDRCAEQVATDILNWLERHRSDRPLWCPLVPCGVNLHTVS